MGYSGAHVWFTVEFVGSRVDSISVVWNCRCSELGARLWKMLAELSNIVFCSFCVEPLAADQLLASRNVHKSFHALDSFRAL